MLFATFTNSAFGKTLDVVIICDEGENFAAA